MKSATPAMLFVIIMTQIGNFLNFPSKLSLAKFASEGKNL